MDFAATLFKRALHESITASVVFEITHSGTQPVYANASFQELTGFSAEEISRGGLELLHGEQTDVQSIADLRRATQNSQELRLTLRSYRRDGRAFWNLLQIMPLRDESGRSTHYLAMLRDVTTEHSHAEQLEYRAHHDPVTGLPNRYLLDHRLAAAIIQAQQVGQSFAVIFIDVNYFKRINDSFGHDAGDGVLRSLAERLTNCVRADDTVSRYGGDEFVVLLNQGSEPVDAELVRERMSQALTPPVLVHEQQVSISCSIGISVYPLDGCDPESLFRHADADMYSNKRRDIAGPHPVVYGPFPGKAGSR